MVDFINGGFEDALGETWYGETYGEGTRTIERSTDISHSGTYSLKFSFDVGTSGYMYQSVPNVSPSDTITFYINVTSTDEGYIKQVQCNVYDIDNGTWYNSIDLLPYLSNTGWQTISFLLADLGLTTTLPHLGYNIYIDRVVPM